MLYTFTEKIFKQGNRHFIEIPFNIWEECGQKGLVPVKVYIKNNTFECKLVPKGAGRYYIPITKNSITIFNDDKEVSVSFEIISGLTRINHDSPYTKQNPIRKIDTIENITYFKAGYCGPLCISMLTGLSIEEIIDIMHARAWQCSFSKIIETLDYFGILHDNKITYTRGKEILLPTCCIVNVKDKQKNHLTLYYKGKYYDTMEIDCSKIIGYLKIVVE